jgi:hypothetical protein
MTTLRSQVDTPTARLPTCSRRLRIKPRRRNLSMRTIQV